MSSAIVSKLINMINENVIEPNDVHITDISTCELENFKNCCDYAVEFSYRGTNLALLHTPFGVSNHVMESYDFVKELDEKTCLFRQTESTNAINEHNKKAIDFALNPKQAEESKETKQAEESKETKQAEESKDGNDFFNEMLFDITVFIMLDLSGKRNESDEQKIKDVISKLSKSFKLMTVENLDIMFNNAHFDLTGFKKHFPEVFERIDKENKIALLKRESNKMKAAYNNDEISKTIDSITEASISGNMVDLLQHTLRLNEQGDELAKGKKITNVTAVEKKNTEELYKDALGSLVTNIVDCITSGIEFDGKSSNAQPVIEQIKNFKTMNVNPSLTSRLTYSMERMMTLYKTNERSNLEIETKQLFSILNFDLSHTDSSLNAHIKRAEDKFEKFFKETKPTSIENILEEMFDPTVSGTKNLETGTLKLLNLLKSNQNNTPFMEEFIKMQEQEFKNLYP